MKITVAGTGYVGLVTAVCFAEKGHNVTCLDISKEKIDKLKRGEATIYEDGLGWLMRKNKKRLFFTTDVKKAYEDAEVIFIGVGTPENEDGSANLDAVYKAAEEIAKYATRECVVVIKSTVPVGTNEKIKDFIEKKCCGRVKIHFASNPEFLAQGTAVNDTLNPARIVIGSSDKFAINTLKRLYKNFMSAIVVTDVKSAEMIKYASNAFLALKISYINEIANLCEILGANVRDVAKGMGLDERIGDKFLKAGIGYGGSCFPKDTKALCSLAKDNGYDMKTVKATIKVNEKQRCRLIDKAKKYYCDFNGLNVTLLGATFKPNTDDLRESPSLYVIKELLEMGANVRVWDPEGLDKINEIFGKKVSCFNDIEASLLDSDICFVMTEWKSVLRLKPQTFKDTMLNPIVLDGRNCFGKEEFLSCGVTYEGIGC